MPVAGRCHDDAVDGQIVLGASLDIGAGGHSEGIWPKIRHWNY